MTRCAVAPVVFLVGPTAVGKTAVAIALALRCGGEILSIDSRQAYRGLDIGTAKPTAAERAAVPHHLIDLFAPTETASAQGFAHEYRRALAGLRERGVRAWAVGGSGLYVDACLGRLDPLPPADAAIRREHARIRDREGTAALYARLREVDPQTAAGLGGRDFRRISRALEVYELAGAPLSGLRTRQGRLDLRSGPPLVLLQREREELYARIEQRAEAMLGAGLLDEVAGLLADGVPIDAPGFEAIGYGDFAAVLAGSCTLAEARERLVRATRRYAKRQITWFRNRYQGVAVVSIAAGECAETTAGRVIAYLGEERGRQGEA
ncbi:MAG: tRNA (adenosine(37)-N6)-dimethylallyltransferase MiaA [Candidatus Eisenbacteria sp.]|nr:tRNA (adenosine(37)-N6)-dimethylallyltransferase MiaA [Candidatus Eisenbacteria bacterium]